MLIQNKNRIFITTIIVVYTFIKINKHRNSQTYIVKV